MSEKEILLNELFRKIAAMEIRDENILNWVLEKLQELRDLKEFPGELDSICVSVVNIVREMLNEAVDFESGYSSLCDAMDILSRKYNELKRSGGVAENKNTRKIPKLIPDEQDMEELGVIVEIFGGLLNELSEDQEHMLDSIENFCLRIFDIVPEGGDFWNKAVKISKLLHLFRTGRRTFDEFKSSMWEICECMKKAYTALETGLAEDEDEAAAQQEPDVDDVADDDVLDEEPAEAIVAEKSDSGMIRDEKFEIFKDYHIDTSNPELSDFLAETNEYLDGLENALMELEKDPSNEEMLHEAFRFMHNVKGISGFLDIKDANMLSHAAESLLNEAREGRVSFSGSISQACFISLDILREMCLRIERAMGGSEYMVPVRFFEALEMLENPEKVAVAQPVARRSELDEIRSIEALEPAEQKPQVSKASVDGDDGGYTKNEGNGNSNKYNAMVKVSTTRLDNLIDAVGELVISNAMIKRVAEECDDMASEMVQNVAQLDNITRDLQELAMSMRMVSLKPTFQRMARITRDLSFNSGVPVEFSFSGEDTEIDRNVVEEVSSPLVHMVRNAVDHGIESPEQRRNLGKPEKGQVHLKAYHEGGSVVIEVTDDGKGLDREQIFRKAVNMGIVAADVELSQRECYNLIFHPGFSTAEKVTDVSGRGVGMDVVKRNIESLRGRVEIQSLKNHGTTFIIKLPLTLAIIDGMMVKCGEEYYIIPTISIQESLRPTDEELATVSNEAEMVSIRGSMAPLFRLDRLMNIPGAKDDPRDGLLLIMGENGDRFALMVDDLLGQQQVVIKSLGKVVGRPPGVSGGAIMGDGKVALILDTQGLKRLANGYEEVMSR